MPDLSRGELLALLAVGSGAMILWAVWLAYRLGRDRGIRCRSPRIERLYSEIDLGGTHWTIAGTSQSGEPNCLGLIKLQQVGVRLVAEGHDAQEHPWSAEGVVFRHGIHLLFMERRDQGIAVGSIHLRLAADGLSMTGMKSAWQGDEGTGAIETVTWKRVALPSGNRDLSATENVANLPHEATTVANRPQSHNVIRPIDRANTELVAPSTTLV